MRYFTWFHGDDSYNRGTAGGSDQAVFPDTPIGIDALRQYLYELTPYGVMIEDGTANLYFADGPEPIELPVDMNLNYVDLDKAKWLDDKNLKTAIQIMSNYDSGAIISASDYYDTKTKELVPDPNAWKMNHSREHLIYILSCIAYTIGPIVTSQTNLKNEWAMANQVLVTRPMTWKKVSREKALELIRGDQTSFQKMDSESRLHGIDPDDDTEADEYGLGFHSWKEENIQKIIAAIITEDPDIFN